MKVDGKGPAPVITGAEVEGKATTGAPEGLTSDAASGPSPAAGKLFADHLSAPPGATSSVTNVTSTAASRAVEVPIADLAAGLRSGTLTAGDAVDRLLDRIVAQTVGAAGPQAARDQVRAALQDALESDPLLAEKLRQLD